MSRAIPPGLIGKAAATWTPADGVNPVLWIKKSSAVDGGGGALASWTDLSGAGHSLTGTVSGPPQIVTGPPSGVDFLGTGYFIVGPSSSGILASRTSFLGFARITPHAVGGSDAGTYWNNPAFFGDAGASTQLDYYTNGGHDYFEYGDYDGAPKVVRSQADHGSEYVVQFWKTGGNLHIRVGNNAEATPVACGAGTGVLDVWNTGMGYPPGGQINALIEEVALFSTFDATTAANARTYFGLGA